MMHQESIYNLIPREYLEPEKPPKYTSKFHDNVKYESKNGKAAARTMGPAKVETNPPAAFLRKHEKEPKLPEKTAFKYVDDERRRPAVPKPDDAPICGLKTTKNFITQNAVENIMSVPKKPAKKYVDTRKGDSQNLEPSGMEPHYTHKKEYGEVPTYLSKRNAEIQQAQEEYDAYIAEHFRRGAMTQIEQQKRQILLDGLKSNWERLHHEYQGLSVVTDTAPKKNRKERMEAEMKQLERDIELIEKHRVILIAN